MPCLVFPFCIHISVINYQNLNNIREPYIRKQAHYQYLPYFTVVIYKSNIQILSVERVIQFNNECSYVNVLEYCVLRSSNS